VRHREQSLLFARHHRETFYIFLKKKNEEEEGISPRHASFHAALRCFSIERNDEKNNDDDETTDTFRSSLSLSLSVRSILCRCVFLSKKESRVVIIRALFFETKKREI
jgi:hypothetical protein